jgi:DNA polymerase III sliding clamp (beta) subunit (PCNA family)
MNTIHKKMMTAIKKGNKKEHCFIASRDNFSLCHNGRLFVKQKTKHDDFTFTHDFNSTDDNKIIGTFKTLYNVIGNIKNPEVYSHYKINIKEIEKAINFCKILCDPESKKLRVEIENNIMYFSGRDDDFGIANDSIDIKPLHNKKSYTIGLNYVFLLSILIYLKQNKHDYATIYIKDAMQPIHFIVPGIHCGIMPMKLDT